MVARDEVYVDIIAETKKAVAGMLKFAAVITSAIVIVRKIHKVMNDLERVYKIQGEAETLFEAALRATGTTAKVSAEKIYALAASLQSVTLFGDEATITAASLLQSLSSLNQEGLDRIIPLMQDFSMGMKIDLQTAASLIGKTLGSTTNALARYGIVVDATLPKDEKLIELTESLENKFGGMAEAMGATAIATKEQLEFAISDLKEQMGRTIAVGMKPFREWMIKIVIEAVKFKEAINDAIEYINKLGKEEVSAVESLKYWNSQLVESESTLRSLWSHMWRGKKIQSKEYIKAKIAEYEIQVKIEEAAGRYDTKVAKRLADELSVATVKAAKIKLLFDIESETLEKLEELRLDALSPLEKELKLIQDELNVYSDLKREFKKYGEDWTTIENVILLLLGKEKKVRAEIANIPLFPALPQAGTPPIAGAAGMGAWGILGTDPGHAMKKITEELEIQIDLSSALASGIGDIASAFGAMFVGQEEGIKKVGEAIKGMIAMTLEALGKQYLIEAAKLAIPMIPIISAPAMAAVGALALATAGAIHAMEGGGVINEPVYGIGKSGQRYLFGESGPERVSPIGKGGGGNVYITVEGSVLAERELEGIALQGMKRLSRGY